MPSSDAPQSEAPVLECTGIRKAFGDHVVLDGVDLVVAPGRITSLLGPSGEGKTTLLRVVAGFEPADAGRVTVHGRVVEGAGRPTPPERRRVGFVPQEGALFPHLSVAANVGFGLPRGRARDSRVADCLELVGLPGAQRRRPHELSGGQQQRVALARALAPRPELVLLDEPFSSLDAALRAQVRDDVAAVLRECGCAAVLVTHDQDEALSVSDEVAVLLDGQVVQCADPLTLYRAPISLAVACFVGDAVVLRGTVAGGHAQSVRCALGDLQLAQDPPADTARDTPADVVVRPEQLRLTASPDRAARADGDGRDRVAGGVAGVVTRTRFHGRDATVDLTLVAGGETVRARVPATDLPAVGAAVGIEVDGTVNAYFMPSSSRSTVSTYSSTRLKITSRTGRTSFMRPTT